jgi:5-methyltetrahydrofolate--homocysteine methyltransferase
MTENELFEGLRDAVIRGDPQTAVSLAERVVQEGLDPIKAYEEGLRAGITQVGEGFSKGDLFLPDLAIAADTMKTAGEILEREIHRRGTSRATIGSIVIGTVAGDLHDIGKTIVGTMLNTRGFEIIDLGVNVSKEAFVEAVAEHEPILLGMSSLLTITAKELKEVINELSARGLRDQVKVMVGGGAVTPEFAEQIGADGYGQDAEQAVRLARSLAGLDQPK